jgi:hypothetical protein
MSSQQASILDTGWQGFSLTGNCQIPDALRSEAGTCGPQFDGGLGRLRGLQNLSCAAMMYSRKLVSMSTTRRSRWLASIMLSMTTDSSVGASGPRETVAAETNRRCA